jgi:hypothetical protein
VAGKSFRLVAGEWVDESYDRYALLPERAIGSAEERARVIAEVPALQPYIPLGRVTVVHDGRVYRFSAEP